MITAGKLGLVLTMITAFAAALSGAVSAADASANDRQGSKDPAWVQELTNESDFTVFMAPGVSSETRRLALRKLWRLLEWKSDGLNGYEFDDDAIETVRRATIAGKSISATSGAYR